MLSGAYASLVLARQQKAPLGALREIWERHAQAASGLPLMQLGMALKLMGDAPRSQQALDLALKTPRNDSRNWMADYGSQLRDNALMLSPAGRVQAAAGCAKQAAERVI